MVKFLKAALAACVAVVAAAGSAQAAQVYLSGSAVDNNDSSLISTWQLWVDYTPSTSDTATVTGALFKVNRSGVLFQWNSVEASGNEIYMAGSKTAYDLTIRFAGAGATSGTPINVGVNQADIDTLTVGGGLPPVSEQKATQANIEYLTTNATVLQGKFIADPFFNSSANGKFLRLNGDPAGITVPEPGSMLLLSGLGLVAGRRVMARRRQQKAKAETETAA